MKKLLPALFIFYFPTILFAGGEPQTNGGRSLALGNSSVTLSDPFSVFNNQGGMAFLKDISIGLFTERKFLLSDIGYNAFGFTLPTKSGVFGVSAGYFGFDLYNEKKAGLAYSRLLTENIAAGIQCDYLGTSIAEYGNASAFTFEAGMMVKIGDKITTGAHVFNPVRVSSGIAGEKIPTTLDIGISYEPDKKVLLTTEAFKDIDQPAQFRAGVEYRIADALHLRCGIQTNPSIYTFGVGINVKNLKIDLASQYHPVLGITPGVALVYSFAKKSSE